ncbi:MAG: hypothetical protein M3R06_00445 [Chloroflexota bacterium]|nr:hypothetical protein [Chloroflexota bacterium]
MVSHVTTTKRLGSKRLSGARPLVLSQPRQRGTSWPLLLWRALWLPFWVASEISPPRLPSLDRRSMAPSHLGLAGAQVARHLTRLCRRIWTQWALHIVARSLWLGLAVACGWLVIELAGGLAAQPGPLLIVEGAGIALGLLLALLARPSQLRVARMLDRSFDLHDRMTTAAGNLGRAVPAEGERASIVYLQMADAANVIAELSSYRAFRPRPPVRELVLGIAWALLLAALFFLRGVGGGIPDVASNSVPPFTPAAERLAAIEAVAAEQVVDDAPTSAQVQERARRSNEAERNLQTLGQALEDHAITRGAADLLQRGDYAAAAQELRDLSASADQLSAAAREGLASDLEQAAGQMTDSSQGLRESSQAAAAGLRQGDEAAQEGVRQLGDAVEETSRNVASQEELASDMQAAQEADANRSADSGSEPSGQENGQEGAQSGQPGGGEPSGGQSSSDRPAEPGDRGYSPQNGGQPGQESQSQPGAESNQGEPYDQANAGQRPGQNQGEGAGQSGQPGDQSGAEGDGQQPGGEAGQQSGLPQPGAGEGMPSDQSSQGSGAGGGESDPSAEQSASAGTGDNAAASEGQPPEQRVTQAQPGQGTGSQETADRESVLLPRSGGTGVRTSEDGGSSRQGTGTGVTARSGTTTQSAVGEAGTDSNRVPPLYRFLVERYFSDSENP